MREPSKRVRDILAKMTVDEKVVQLSCIMPAMLLKDGVFDQEKADANMPHGIGRFTQWANSFMRGPRAAAEAYNAIQRDIIAKCGVPAFIQNESSTGLVSPDGTVFPIPLALSATWKQERAREMGEVITDEGRALGAKAMMSPVADVAREGRWGRVGETFGEDPQLVARFSSEEVKGIQGDDYTKRCAALAKHFLGYGVSEGGVNCATVNIGPRELYEVYGMPFEAAIKEADMQSVMVTYSDIDGLPMSVNPRYTQDLLRGKMGFTGLTVCDGHSIPRVIETQGMYADRAELAAASLKAGLDADTMTTTVYNHIPEALERGLVSMEELDACVLRVLQHKEEFGLLDNPYLDVDAVEAAFGHPEARELSEQIAEESMTLLKNEKGVLPIPATVGKIGVVGPFAERLSSMFGGYAYPCMMSGFLGMAINPENDVRMEGFADMAEKMMDIKAVKERMYRDPSKGFQENMNEWLRRDYGMTSLTEELATALPDAEVAYAYGPHNGAENWREEISDAADVVADADVIIFAAGEVTGFGSEATSGEGTNNPDLGLPGHQQEMLEKLAKLGRPIVMVLFNGRALALGEAEPLCDAILEAWYPGPSASRVVARALTGETNPGGKLTVTVPRISSQCPIYYGTKTGSGYMNVRQEPAPDVLQPLYPFGYGLSYTTFSISDLKVDESVAVGDAFKVSVSVTNTGEVAGDETVQIYSHSVCPTINRPIKELRAWKRVSLAPGETRRISFTLDTRQFGYLNARDEFVVEARPQEIFACYDSSTIAERARIEFTGADREVSSERVFDFEVEVA